MPYQIYVKHLGGGTYRYSLKEEVTGKLMRLAVTRNSHSPPPDMEAYCDELNAPYEMEDDQCK